MRTPVRRESSAAFTVRAHQDVVRRIERHQLRVVGECVHRCADVRRVSRGKVKLPGGATSQFDDIVVFGHSGGRVEIVGCDDAGDGIDVGVLPRCSATAI